MSFLTVLALDVSGAPFIVEVSYSMIFDAIVFPLTRAGGLFYSIVNMKEQCLLFLLLSMPPKI
jgi:hypothetical protein